MATEADKKAEGQNYWLCEAFRHACGLIPGFFRIGGAETLGTDIQWDRYTREQIEALEREYFGGKWGQPRPDVAERQRRQRNRSG